MSWFTDLAGKAEGFLNQIDQSAAVALQTSGSNSSTGKNETLDRSERSRAAFVDYMTPREQLGPAVESPIRREHRSSGYASSVSSSQVSKPPPPPTKAEEELMDFLNDRPSSTAPLSRRSSAASLRSLPAHLSAQAQEVTSEQTAAPATQPAPASDRPFEFASTSRLERELFDSRSREADLQKATQAKDSQLAVLRVRYQEADENLQQKTAAYNKLSTERQRLLKDSADSTEVRNKALETLQKQLQDLERELATEKQGAKRIEVEYMSRVQKLEEDGAALATQLTHVQKCLTDEKLKARDVSEQLRLAKYNLEANKQDFDDYKQKAQRILQSKEKLIDTLKDGGGGGVDGERANLAVELEELRTDRDLLKEDLQQAQLQLYNVRAEIQELESQLAAEQRAALESQRSLQEQCQTYQHSATQHREQHEQLKLEYQYMQDEFRRQQVSLQTKLQEKDAEIVRLMKESSTRSMASATYSPEAEQRIRHLTENLIHKQTLIESLQTDKNSIALQLERTERMYREAESAAIRASSTAIPMDDALSEDSFSQ